MAEFVQHRKELSLAEYESMKKIKLFDDDELKKIKRARENYEYKIEKQTKELQDYCEYIKYERSLLGIIGDRRLIRHIKEKRAIERLIGIKIHHLYSKTLQRFPGDIRLWESFIKFCRGTSFNEDIPKIHDRMLQLHIGKPDVWAKAIMWEYAELHNMVRIKHLMTNALKLHSRDKTLNKLFIQIELVEAQVIQESEELTDDQKDNEINIALLHCEKVFENFGNKDLDFVIEILHLSLAYPFAAVFSTKILHNLREKNDPKVWNCFAQSELAGVTLFDVSDKLTGIVRGPRTTKTNIEKCMAVYEYAVTQVPCQEMYGFFIDAMLELNNDMTTNRKLRRSCLGNAFKLAHEAGFMSEKHYLIYLQLLLEGDSINTGQLEDIFNKALLDNSVDVWKLRFVYGMKHENKEKLQELFQTVTEKVSGEGVLEIYKLFFSFLSTNSDNKVTERFLASAIKHENRVVASHFKEEYIEWLCLNKGITAARKTYKELALNSFPCLELHTKMVSIELSQEPVDADATRRCFDYAAQLFGYKEVSMWVNYIRFELKHGNPQMSTNLYQRARSTLKGNELIENFIQEHNLMQLELGNLFSTNIKM